jgi:hypothetical protein
MPAPVPVVREFFFLPDAEPEPVSAQDLHELMKLWRHGRATRSLGQAISDGYVTVFTILMLGAMIISAVLSAQHGMADCTTGTCASSRLLLPTAVLLGCYALTMALARLFGPVLVSAAEGFWLLDAPMDRRRLLSGRLVVPLVSAFVLPGLATGLVAGLTGMDWSAVGVWTLAAAAGSAALVALAAAQQSGERSTLTAVVQGVAAAAGLAVIALVVAVAADKVPAESLSGIESARWVFLALAIAALIAGGFWLTLAIRRLDRLRRTRLASGGALVSGMQGAMFALDFGLIRDILVERRAAAIGHVRPTRGRGLGLAALIWRDVERLRRNPRMFIGLAISLFVPYAVDALRLSQLNPLISGLALVAALVPFLGGLRVLSRTGGLARGLPFKTASLRTASMAVPAVVALVWAAAAVPAFVGVAGTGADRSLADGAVASLITAAAGLLGGVRWVSAKKVDFGMPMVATQNGAVPPALIFNLLRGIDMVALICAPLILGWPAYWSAVLMVVAFVGLRGSFNVEDLRAEAESAQRDLDSAKAERAKTKIPPPRR